MEFKSEKDERAMMKDKLFERLEKLVKYSKAHITFSSAIINFATILMTFDRAPINIRKQIVSAFGDMTNEDLIKLLLNPHTTITLTTEPCYIPKAPSLPMSQNPLIQGMYACQGAEQQMNQMLAQQLGSPSLSQLGIYTMPMDAQQSYLQPVTEQLPGITQNQSSFVTHKQYFQNNSNVDTIVIEDPVQILEQHIFTTQQK